MIYFRASQTIRYLAAFHGILMLISLTFACKAPPPDQSAEVQNFCLPGTIECENQAKIQENNQKGFFGVSGISSILCRIARSPEVDRVQDQAESNYRQLLADLDAAKKAGDDAKIQELEGKIKIAEDPGQSPSLLNYREPVYWDNEVFAPAFNKAKAAYTLPYRYVQDYTGADTPLVYQNNSCCKLQCGSNMDDGSKFAITDKCIPFEPKQYQRITAYQQGAGGSKSQIAEVCKIRMSNAWVKYDPNLDERQQDDSSNDRSLSQRVEDKVSAATGLDFAGRNTAFKNAKPNDRKACNDDVDNLILLKGTQREKEMFPGIKFGYRTMTSVQPVTFVCRNAISSRLIQTDDQGRQYVDASRRN